MTSAAYPLLHWDESSAAWWCNEQIGCPSTWWSEPKKSRDSKRSLDLSALENSAGPQWRCAGAESVLLWGGGISKLKLNHAHQQMQRETITVRKSVKGFGKISWRIVHKSSTKLEVSKWKGSLSRGKMCNVSRGNTCYRELASSMSLLLDPFNISNV